MRHFGAITGPNQPDLGTGSVRGEKTLSYLLLQLPWRSLPVKPANHTDGAVMNKFSDKFLVEIIAKGGGALGKSAMMPGWGGQFKENQLRDIVAYVRSIADPPYKPSGK